MNFLNNLKLRSKMIMQTSLIGGAILIIGIVMTIILEQQKSIIEENLITNLARNKAIVDITHAAKDINKDVIQIQQWLTDISATRALDGLNDGFDEAENNAQKFRADMNFALGISRNLRLNDVTATLNDINAAFPSYYETGTRMAQSYIDLGPAGGNKIMAQFDTAAERINTAVSQLLELTGEELNKQDALMSDNMEDITSSLTMIETLNIIGILIVLFIAALSVFLIQKIVGNPLTELNKLMLKLANGEDDLKLPDTDRQDEIGEMANTLQTFQQNSIENKKLEKENREAAEEGQRVRSEARQEEEKRRQVEMEKERDDLAEREARNNKISDLIQNFENSITDMMQVMTSSAQQMSETAHNMVETSTNTKERSSTVAVTSDNAADNVNTVASAAEELSHSIQEIGRQVTEASNISQEAVQEASKSEEAISALATASEKINDVISIISDIAEQTNLLALNATIESARAGEAGRGFAVVASEVKTLAGQTSNATDEISGQIQEMQQLTQQAVNSIKNIVAVNNKSNETTSSIQQAIEQQNIATNEISNNIQLVATGTNEVSSNITLVAKGADETGVAGQQVLTVANDLGEISENLKKDIQQFLKDVRSV